MEQYLPLSSSHMDYFEPIHMFFQAKDLLKKHVCIECFNLREILFSKKFIQIGWGTTKANFNYHFLFLKPSESFKEKMAIVLSNCPSNFWTEFFKNYSNFFEKNQTKMLKLMEVGHFYQAYYKHDKFVWNLQVHSILNSNVEEELHYCYLEILGHSFQFSICTTNKRFVSSFLTCNERGKCFHGSFVWIWNIKILQVLLHNHTVSHLFHDFRWHDCISNTYYIKQTEG